MNSLKHSEPPAPNAKSRPHTQAVPLGLPLPGSYTGNSVVGKQRPLHPSTNADVAGGAFALADGLPLAMHCSFCVAAAGLAETTSAASAAVVSAIEAHRVLGSRLGRRGQATPSRFIRLA
jgi:hypothetical protein